MRSNAAGTMPGSIAGPWQLAIVRTPIQASRPTSAANRSGSTSDTHGLFHCWNAANPVDHSSRSSSEAQRVGEATGAANASDAQYTPVVGSDSPRVVGSS